MERRVLLAFLLSLLVLLAYQSLLVPPAPAPADGEATPAQPGAAQVAAPGPAETPSLLTTPAPTTTPAPLTAPGAGSGSGDPTATAPAPDAADAASSSDAAAGDPDAVDAAPPAPVVAADAPAEVVVESDLIRAVFTNRGASLVSWRLKRHLEQPGGAPIDLVPPDLPADEPAPFTLLFDDPALTGRAAEALFRSSAAALALTDREEALTFDFEASDGFRVRKTYTFDPSPPGYVVRMRVEAALGNRRLTPALTWGPALGGIEASTSGMAYREGPRGVLLGRLLEPEPSAEEDLVRLDAGEIVEFPIYGGRLRFAGVDNHYFLAAALLDNQEARVAYRYAPLPPRTPDGPTRDLVAFDLRAPDGAIDLPFFLGPKEFEALELVDPLLVQSIDFGWLGWLVVPLHRSLSWVHDYVDNWGWAIVILTILVNIVISPLRHKSVVSMRKMQEVQPEMKAIQERYAHLKASDPDKQKMNQEIMTLYRERGVNPASGCLPMVLTFPVLFAFFSLLRSAVEIRGQPFVGWIADLSVEDPLYITPIVMGASMVLQQKMTPTQADPMQQRIMMIMPVVFTFMFVWAPSGLVLYWLTSNVIGILQTVVTNRVIGPPKTRAVRPPAERRVRQGKGGSGGVGAGAGGKRGQGGQGGAKKKVHDRG